MNLVGVSYKEVAVEVREKLALTQEEQVLFLQKLRHHFSILEAFILSTCNRVEIYYFSNKKEILTVHLIEFLLKWKKINLKEIPFFSKEQKAAYLHFFQVSCGLESMVLGEVQIIKQIKEAEKTSRQSGLFGFRLQFLFPKMSFITKKVHTQTDISKNALSVGSSAVQLAKTIFGSLTKKKVMVIGSGETAELILQHLSDNGVDDIILANRTFEKALRLSEKYQGTAIWFSDCYKYLEQVDIVLSSTSSSEFIITASQCKGLLKRKSPLFFIDVAVPRDIDPEINNFSTCYLYHIDDLQQIAFSNYGIRKKETIKAKEIIEQETKNFLQNLHWKKNTPIIQKLKKNQTKIIEKELQLFFAKNSTCRIHQEKIEKLIQRINEKFLYKPYLFLKHNNKEEEKKIFCDIFELPFSVTPQKKKVIEFQPKIKNEQKI